eukprot:TRINITY_DN3416_c0_g2_i2.p3 TRINITY_DN3416_c0_g2~~TRINITY_DN3416_c0_g2_i2.p3  ORF type:complete len:197 (+),score=-20.22 TRINITY_DN3416_c0_g2_i2:175-765(+)
MSINNFGSKMKINSDSSIHSFFKEIMLFPCNKFTRLFVLFKSTVLKQTYYLIGPLTTKTNIKSLKQQYLLLHTFKTNFAICSSKKQITIGRKFDNPISQLSPKFYRQKYIQQRTIQTTQCSHKTYQNITLSTPQLQKLPNRFPKTHEKDKITTPSICSLLFPIITCIQYQMPSSCQLRICTCMHLSYTIKRKKSKN